MPNQGTKSKVITLRQSVDRHEDFSYDFRYLDALAATLNISTGRCAAVVNHEPGKYSLAYNVEEKQLANHKQTLEQPRHIKLLPYFIHDLNSKKVDTLLGKYLAFTQNALAIFNGATDRSLDETPFYRKILEMKATFRKAKADTYQYKFSTIKLSMSNQTGLDKIKSFENKVKIHQTQIKKLQSEEDEQTKDQLIFSIERIKMKIEALTSLPKLLSKKLTTLIAEDKIEEAILYVQRDDAVLSAVEKEKLITKLGFIQNFEEALANAAREYKEIVLDEANKPENQKIFLSPDSKSPFKYLLRPIQDTAKLISYFTQEGIVIRKMEVIWPNEIEKGMVKHCEEILYEKFPREDYIGISHLSCASCTEAVPHEKHRGDSYIAFEGTTHFEALTQAYEQAQAEGDSTMFRSISYDPDLWAASPILAGETPQAQTIEPIA